MNDTSERSLYELLAAWQAAVSGTRLPRPPEYTGPDVRLTAIVEHTDAVSAGACFVARVRETSDGHPYIPQAVARGAGLILGQLSRNALPFALDAEIPYLRVADTALAEAWLAAAWEGFPGRELVMVGITGTDGKTTTANLLHGMLQAGGTAAGLLSTLRAVIGGREEALELHVTTPEAPVVQRHLRRMVDAGLTHCVLETTSHGLAQHRVAAIDFDLAVITNITHEHLDYHGSWEAYLAAKARLLHYLGTGDWALPSNNPIKGSVLKTAVLNGDDASYRELRVPAGVRKVTYRRSEPADVCATDVHFGSEATRFHLHLPAGNGSRTVIDITSHMAGDFNVDNMLAAAAAAHCLGVSPAAIRQGVRQTRSLKGRMERIVAGQPFMVIVDFAHTPNGLAKAIEAGKRMITGRLITVFGSAGKRDVEKRRMMAEISAAEADVTILTAEDPRTEELSDILEAMAAGCRSRGKIEGRDFRRIPDRGRAIYHALKLAGPDDLVLICGKGHEQSMCFGVTEYPWDDAEAARTAIAALMSGEPMPDLGLPTFN